MRATLRVTRQGQAVVADREAGEAQLVGAEPGRRWPSDGSYAREVFSRGLRQTRESSNAISRVSLQTRDWDY
ncbi:MAG: hypothetical protein AUH32_04825 [Actinobacteria bacterium 13_1_40CM_66_12]|nr:MAG: hypothetical protein AUH32_04825 [Actinobacteria bacterium 13_1_40CM_66_12]